MQSAAASEVATLKELTAKVGVVLDEAAAAGVPIPFRLSLNSMAMVVSLGLITLDDLNQWAEWLDTLVFLNGEVAGGPMHTMTTERHGITLMAYVVEL